MQSGWALAATLIGVVYIAVCFGRIAAKHGRNPWLYGILSVVSPVNLVILGYWAFSGAETGRVEVNVTPPSGGRPAG
jgi:MFS family permease